MPKVGRSWNIEERLVDAFYEFCRGRRMKIEEGVAAAMLTMLEAPESEQNAWIRQFAEWSDGKAVGYLPPPESSSPTEAKRRKVS